jgi:hypothetical protein
VLALGPTLVWLTHEGQPWRPASGGASGHVR